MVLHSKLIAGLAISLTLASVLVVGRVEATSEFQTVHGVAWYDDNSNGKLDQDETLAGGIGLQVEVDTAKYSPEIAYYRATVPNRAGR